MMKSMMLVCVALTALTLGAGEGFPLTVDFSRDAGVVRKLNGVCNAAPLANAQTGSLEPLVRQLEIPYYRFHDAPLENPGIQLIDVSRIFPLFHADADDPRNYDFRATDDYLRQVVDAGAKIEFRLGESIEHSRRKYYVQAPPDFEKWADICVHIIRHYNEGWANGFRWNIEYWSVWEEPDTNPELLTGAKNPFVNIYLPLYRTTARRIRKEFPGLKICGPQGCGDRNLKVFVDYCAANGLPIDVYGWTAYSRDPEDYARVTRRIRAYLDEKGFHDTKIAICEWHWGPESWHLWENITDERLARAWDADLCGIDSGAFAAAMLVHMQDMPVDFMYYYEMKSYLWGLFDARGFRLPSYWAFWAFAQVARGDVRVAAPANPRPGWWMLASKNRAAKRGQVLVTALHAHGELMPTNSRVVRLKLLGCAKPVRVKLADGVREMTDFTSWKWNQGKQELVIDRDLGDSSIWLIEVEL